jgi:hypothetical protein
MEAGTVGMPRSSRRAVVASQSRQSSPSQVEKPRK